MTPDSADPSLLRADNRDRFSDRLRLLTGQINIGSRLEAGAPPAKGRFRAVFLCGPPDLITDPGPLGAARAQELVEGRALLQQSVALGANLDLLELAQGAQAHVENGLGLRIAELERPHENGFRFIFGADDPDHHIEVEVGNQIAVQHLEPAGNLVEPEPGSANQDLLAVIQPLAQSLAQ